MLFTPPVRHSRIAFVDGGIFEVAKTDPRPGSRIAKRPLTTLSGHPSRTSAFDPKQTRLYRTSSLYFAATAGLTTYPDGVRIKSAVSGIAPLGMIGSDAVSGQTDFILGTRLSLNRVERRES